MTFDFAPVDERLPVRVVLDPLPTIMTSLVELFGPFRSRLPPGLPKRAASLARGLDLTPLALVLADPLGAGAPDFSTRLERRQEVTTATDAVELLRSESRDDVYRDIETYASYSPAAARAVTGWRKDDRRALTRFADAVSTYWHRVLLPLYPNLEQRLQREADRLRDVVDELGPVAATAALHPGLDVDVAATSTLERNQPTPAHTDELYLVDALLLKPMLCAQRTSLSNLGFPLTSAAVFSCATPALVARNLPPLPRNGLDMLLGRSRARILRRLRDRPTTTTQLAQLLGLAPSTVSQHLSALAAAGAVHPTRQGPEVLYLLTDRGLRLLDV